MNKHQCYQHISYEYNALFTQAGWNFDKMGGGQCLKLLYSHICRQVGFMVSGQVMASDVYRLNATGSVQFEGR